MTSTLVVIGIFAALGIAIEARLASTRTRRLLTISFNETREELRYLRSLAETAFPDPHDIVSRLNEIEDSVDWLGQELEGTAPDEP